MSSLLRGNGRTTRAAPRGPSTRGRGRGRGALSSSSKFSIQHTPSIVSLRVSNAPFKSHGRGRVSRSQQNDGSSIKTAGSNVNANSTNSASLDHFEKERQENAAKRAQRGAEATKSSLRGRGTSRGPGTNKRVHFDTGNSSSDSRPTATPFNTSFGTMNGVTNSSSTMATSSPWASSTTTLTANGSTNTNPFGATTTSSNTNSTVFNPFAAPTSQPAPAFGTSTLSNGNNPFAKPFPSPTSTTTTFPAPSVKPSPFITSTPSPAPFGAPAVSANPFSKAVPNAPVFGASSASPNGTGAFFKPSTNASFPTPANTTDVFSKQPTSVSSFGGFGQKTSVQNPPHAEPVISIDKWAVEIEDFLLGQGIKAPRWPMSNPGDPSQKGAVESYWQAYKGYRAKVRAALIKHGYLDDPDKPKKLSEAIDFKGTCEGMCPEFEKITRIMEHDVQGAEKAPSPDGTTMWPSLPKMVKALARSAAGQDAPLPADVRSPAALKRTLDYLIDTILGNNDLASVHGFLWDRTRAIRRDFVFQQQSMNTREELLSEVYCLEHITRFHVIALHQMSKADVVAEDFSEQQEIEQLGKALLSLIHAYEDCKGHDIVCEHEAEFRAYHIIFNGQYSGIMEQVQDWGWGLWDSSDQIQSAVTLVETLQNTWTPQGPLRPHAPTDIALNAYARFFSIVKDSSISYTMACFCEIHFTRVRKAILKTILAAYRKQRDQTRDWTLSNLNTYLQFDDEDDIIPFCEAYGLRFEQSGDEEFLYLDSDDAVQDPFPPLKQTHSRSLVEKKRGNRILPDVIHQTVFAEEQEEEKEREDSMFIPETMEPVQGSPKLSSFQRFSQDTHSAPSSPSNSPVPSPSIFGSKPTAPSAGSIFGTKPASSPATSFLSSPKTQQPEQPNTSDSDPKPFIFSSPSVSKLSSPFVFGQTPQTETDAKKTNTQPASPTAQIPKQVKPNPSSSPAVQPFVSFEKFSSSSQPSPPNARQFKLPGLDLPETIESLSTETSPVPVLPQPLKPTPETPLQPTSQSSEKASLPSSPASVFSVAPAPRRAQEPTATPTPPPPEPGLQEFAEWFALGRNGIVDQFTSYTIENILIKTFAQFEADELQKQLDEEHRIACEEADKFRVRSLATRYGHRWRENARVLWLRRRGRQGRQARRKMAEDLRVSRASQSETLAEDFRQSTQRSVPQDILRSTGALNRVHNPDQDVRRIMSDSSGSMKPPQNGVTRKRPRGFTQSQTSSPDRSSSQLSSLCRSLSQQSHLRTSIMSDPALLAGGTRSHLFANKWTPEEDRRKQVSGVQTDYFRLKARGIMTLPDGSPLATSAAKQLLTRKASYDSLDRSSTSPRPTRRPNARSVPSKLNADGIAAVRPSIEREEFTKIKSQAQAYMANDMESRYSQGTKRVFDDDEEELFAKAKRIREAMDEGACWYREEVERQSSTGSVS